MTRLAVIIPTFNRWNDAQKCLLSLKKDEFGQKRVFLVNDGSTDDTGIQAALSFPEVEVINGDGNLWWSGAINLGLKTALQQNPDCILWLNDDNQVEPQTITRMIESHIRCGPKSVICARTRSLETGQDEWVGEPPRWHPDFGKWTAPDLPQPDVPLEHPPGGRGVLIPAECFREVGLIDRKTFPHYWADHDFHYRAMKAGYKYYLATEAVVWNAPNSRRPGDPDEFTLRWIWNFLFTRRSPMNLPTLRRLLRRHLPREEFRRTFYPLAFDTLKWLGSGWVAGKPLIHRSLRALRRAF
ncbi:MAG: glycosyltransferase family 2 protein [Blastocatellales bacterium]